MPELSLRGLLGFFLTLASLVSLPEEAPARVERNCWKHRGGGGSRDLQLLSGPISLILSEELQA